MKTSHGCYYDDFGRECSVCGIYKEWSNFSKHTGFLYDKSCWCRDCTRIKYGQKPIPKYKIDDFGRECTVCGQYKHWSEFYKNKRGRNGKDGLCKVCKKNKDLLRRYGITIEVYNRILEDQNGTCAICGKNDSSRLLAVDHNHSTGELRGLLCGDCNRGLGMFYDSTKSLKSAITYLEKHK